MKLIYLKHPGCSGGGMQVHRVLGLITRNKRGAWLSFCLKPRQFSWGHKYIKP